MIFRKSVAWAAALASLGFSPGVLAAGDGATRFNLYVPPNNIGGRDSNLIVTNVSPFETNVTIIDDDADGDSDDSASTVLRQGESYLVRMGEGAVNDDYGGKHDGDYFLVRSDHPVIVQMATQSNWQHDWVPSERGGGRGKTFFVYAPPSSGADNDANVFSYVDDTVVTIRDITTQAVVSTGKTRVDLNTSTLVLSDTLAQGEDLIARNRGLGLDILDPGHTYWVQASRPVTLQYGHLGDVVGSNQARDGAGFVPSVDGSTTGALYYFGIPHNPGREQEKELRVSCFDDVSVSVFGATATSSSFVPIATATVKSGGHFDLTGASNPDFRDHSLYRLEVSPSDHRCTVFEGNWLETGSFGTSDFASAVSAANGSNLGRLFSAYLGPPGQQHNVAHPLGERTNDSDPVDGLASHLYVYAVSEGTQVTVEDVDTGGEIFRTVFELDEDEYFDTVVDAPTYRNLTDSGHRPYFRVSSSEPVMVMNGNFNDNWMAYFHSTMRHDPVAEISSEKDVLLCGESTKLTLSCENGSDAAQVLKARVNLPEGLTPSSVPEGAVPTSEGWEFTSTVASQNVTSWNMNVNFDCSDGACNSRLLSAITLECAMTTDGEVSARLASTQITLAGHEGTVLTRFAAQDEPDYESAEPQPAVHLSVEIESPSVGTLRVLRAVDDPDPDAAQAVVAEVPLAQGVQSFTFEDPYSLHYRETRYYRLQTVSSGGACSTDYGPEALQTSSDMSSGIDSGLESNGNISTKLARRAILRTSWPTAIEPALLRKLGSGGIKAAALDRASELSALVPTHGPYETAPINVTPGDLPALTNAKEVLSADYVRSDGSSTVSVLAIRTVGETYDHSKSLCDRAAGGELDAIESIPSQQGELLRFRLRNEKKAVGEYAVAFKAYATESGYEIHSAWLREGYPEVKDDQEVINYQVWSSTPGLALSLAEDIATLLDARLPVESEPPEGFFHRVGTLGGRLSADYQSAEGLRLKHTYLLEDGTTQKTAARSLEEGVEDAPRRFLDVTLEIVDESGKVVDRVWASDGAWTLMDDAMTGGATRVTHERFTCVPREGEEGREDDESLPNALSLSGCAEVEAEVEEFAGVARHIAGAGAPLDLGRFSEVRLDVEATTPVEICLHQEGGAQACVQSEGAPDGELRIPLNRFKGASCEELDLDRVQLVSVLSHRPGPVRISAQNLEFYPELSNESTNVGTRTCFGESPQPSTTLLGCTTSQPGSAPRRNSTWLLLAGLSVVLLRRIRRSCSR